MSNQGQCEAVLASAGQCQRPGTWRLVADVTMSPAGGRITAGILITAIFQGSEAEELKRPHYRAIPRFHPVCAEAAP